MVEPKISSTYCFVTNRCNFDCSYCYEKVRTGDMTKETMKAVIDYLIGEHKKHPTVRANEMSDIAITFFGGEPLLNWSIVKYGIEYALAYEEEFGTSFSFYILTNGSIWTQEIHDYLTPLKKRLGCRIQMQISLDGCEVSHDKTRKLKSGDGTFAKVIENAEKYNTIFKNLIVRETLIPEKIDYWIDDYKALSKISNTVSFTPIVEGDWKSVLDKVPAVINELFDLYEEQLKSDRNRTFSLLSGNLTAKFRENQPYRGCHAGAHLVGITTTGEIYPCHRFLSYRHIFDYKLGDVWNGIDASNPKYEEVLNAHINNEDCNRCESYSCNKCYATNMVLNKNLVDRPATGYCDFVKIVQDLVDVRSDRVFVNCDYALQPWNCYKSPNSKRRGIKMEGSQKIFGPDAEDVIVQAMSLLLKTMHNIEEQNKVMILLLKELVGDKKESPVAEKDSSCQCT